MNIQVLSLESRVSVVQISRPERRNALSLAVKRELETALLELDADPEVRAIVLEGSDGIFVSGTDIDELVTLTPAEHVAQQTGRIFTTVDSLQTPIIAAVEGYAFGGGCELALACDFVVAGESALFAQPEILVGLIPGAGGLSRLVQRAGRAQAVRLALTGERITANVARELGIVTDVVPDGSAHERAVALATVIAAQPPLNVAAIRELVRIAENAPLHVALDAERARFCALFDSYDAIEGLTAFLEKRPARYQGR